MVFEDLFGVYAAIDERYDLCAQARPVGGEHIAFGSGYFLDGMC